MKKAIMSLLVLGLAACQSRPGPTITEQYSTVETPKTASITPNELLAVSASYFTAADTLPAQAKAMLQQINLSELWRSFNNTDPKPLILEGFFGPDHYRFEVVFTQVRRDNKQPEVYHVEGKTHYRKNVRPFSGTLIIRQLADLNASWDYDDFVPAQTELLPPDTVEARYERARQQSHPYTARAELQLKEALTPDSGIFMGEAILNFFVTDTHRIGYVVEPVLNPQHPAGGAAILLRGSRLNQSTRQIKQFVVASDKFAAAPDIYQDFGVGERSHQVSPKYAHLGWNEEWQNEEWWTDSPKATL